MNGEMRDYTREEMLELTPARYLAEGYLDGSGHPLPALLSTYASAATTQLLDGELAPQELVFAYEALQQTLPLHSGAPAQRLDAATTEALDLVRAMIQQPNNPRLKQWMRECVSSVKTPADLDAFLGHFMAVLRQYTVIVASRSR